MLWPAAKTVVALTGHDSPPSENRNSMTLAKRWWPVVTWAAVIFFFSTDYFSAPHTARFLTPILAWLFPAITPEQTALVHLLVRKFGHFAEYFVLSVLLMNALKGDGNGWSMRRSAFWTLVVVLAYAASDELHQSFVVGRSATVKDVLIDFAGGLGGTLWISRRYG